jgi:hypothetical protein
VNAAFMWKRDLDMQVTPAIFKYKDRELVVTSSKECRVFLLDSKALGGPDHRAPLVRTPLVCNEEVNFAAAGVWGSMATWEDSKGTRWALAPFSGPVHLQFKAPISYHSRPKNGQVYVRITANGGNTIIGGIEATSDTTYTLAIANCAFMGPAISTLANFLSL